MTASPAVSVVMPVLNPDPVFFPQAVASVVGQTLTDWELVIVEDPSPSSAAELLRAFPDPRIRHIAHRERTSLRFQRNRGLEEARADFIALLDADDVAAPDRLEKQLGFLRSHPEVGVVGSDLRIIDTHGHELGYRHYPDDHEGIVRGMRRYNAVGQPSVMLRKAVALAAGGYQMDGPAEDYDLWCRLAVGGVRFANLPEPLVNYRLHPAASKGTQLRKTIENSRAIKRRYWWGQMTLLDRLRYWLEKVLLWLPPPLVYRLFTLASYRRTAPARGREQRKG